MDSLATVITAINNSGAGVVASVDRTNDKLLLTRKDTGALAIDIEDTSGNLGATMRLAPGTTNAQTVGLSAQVTVDGRTITSTTNTITNAIEGVTINAIKQSSLGVTQTLTVGVDSTAVANALTNLAKSYNSLADTLDSLTASTPGTPGGTAGTTGPLATDTTARTLLTSLRDTLFGPVGSGAYNSLGTIGLSTGAIGSAVGTTNRLQLDSSALTAAMNADPSRVASLLDSATGPIGNLAAQLKGLEDPSNTGSYVQAHAAGLGREISQLQRDEADQQTMITNYQATIEAQYAAMESTLAMLQAQSASIASTLGQTSTSSSGSGLGNSSSG